MIRARLVAAFGLWLMLEAPLPAATRFFPMAQISVVQYGGYVNDVFTATFPFRQINFQIDLENGRGFYDGQEGIIAVPIKDLSEEQIDKGSKTHLGAPLCHLFVGPGFKLLTSGKPIDKAKLRFSKGLNHAGEESQSSCFVCTVRREGANLELCLYGAEPEPALTTRFANVLAENPTSFECKLTAANANRALAVTLFGEYEATLPFAIDRAGLGPADDLMTARFGVSPRRDLQGPTSAATTPRGAPGASVGSQLQFDIERTGYWPNGDSLPKAPGILWKRPSDDEADQFVPGTPVVDRGIIYFGDNRSRLHAVKAGDGKDKWVRTYKGRMLAAPAIAEDAAFLVTSDDVKCVSLDSGEVRWSREVPSAFGSAPPLVVGEAVFVAGGDGFYAFKRADGKPIWNHNALADRPVVTPSFATQYAAESAGTTRTSGSASDGSLLFEELYDQCRVVALDCRDGKQHWSYSARMAHGQPGVERELGAVRRARSLSALRRSADGKSALEKPDRRRGGRRPRGRQRLRLLHRAQFARALHRSRDGQTHLDVSHGSGRRRNGLCLCASRQRQSGHSRLDERLSVRPRRAHGRIQMGAFIGQSLPDHECGTCHRREAALRGDARHPVCAEHGSCFRRRRSLIGFPAGRATAAKEFP